MSTRARVRTALTVFRLCFLFAVLTIAKRILPLSLLVRGSWKAPSRRRTRRVDHIAGTVLRATALFGAGDRFCVERSLMLFRELAVQGYEPELSVGFNRVKDDGALTGHAWVTIQGRVVVEPDPVERGLVQALRFGRAGALLT